MNLQHNIAQKLMHIILEQERIQEDGVIVTYGIEIFINEFSKLFTGLLIGIALGILKDVIFMEIYLILLRRVAGGRHFKNNIVCFCVSVLTIVGVPLIANSITLWNTRIVLIIIVIEAALLILLTPLYEWKPNCKEKIKAKIHAVCILFLFATACNFISKPEYIYMVMLFTIIEIISLIRNFN